MASNNTENDHGTANGQRLSYQAPKLTIFGCVRNLTATGTGTMTEGPGGGNNGPDRMA